MNNKKRFVRICGLILFFGLCIAMRSKGVGAFAAENDPKLNVTSVSVVMDGSYKLKVYNMTDDQTVVYRSSDTAIATVSKTGKIKGVSCGTAVITATVLEADAPIATLQCDVLIGPAAVSIKLTKTNLVLAIGKTKSLNTIVFPLNTVETVTFYSADTGVAKVSSAGRIRAVSAGAVQIYAFIANGQSAVCNVNVLDDEDYAKYLDGMTLEEILNETADDVEENTDGTETEEEKAEEITPTPVPEVDDESTTAQDETPAEAGMTSKQESVN